LNKWIANDVDIGAVQTRIAADLESLARPRRVAGQPVAPPAYVRRHGAEHASAGGALIGSAFLTLDFLPFADHHRLRPLLNRETALNRTPGDHIVEAFQRCVYAWNWDHSVQNRDTLLFQLRAIDGLHVPFEAGGMWRTTWARWATGAGWILGRHTDAVSALVTGALPDGTVVAVITDDDTM
jgi:hypothetical protein